MGTDAAIWTDELISDIRDLRERMVRIETKLDNHADNHAALKVTTDDHEVRIRELEGQGARLLGIGAILALLTGIFGDNLASAVTGHAL